MYESRQVISMIGVLGSCVDCLIWLLLLATWCLPFLVIAALVTVEVLMGPLGEAFLPNALSRFQNLYSVSNESAVTFL